MAALTDLSDAINRATGGNSGTPENIFMFKDARVDTGAAQAPVAGRITSLWQYEGLPSGGAAPGGTVAVPDNTTTGGLLQTDPGGGRTKWLTGVTGCCNAAGTLIVYDRLLHISGLSATTTTAQTVGGTLTRYTGTESKGNQIWLEIYSAIGTTGTTITAQYTDQDGNTAITSTATGFGGTGLREVQRIIPVPLASGDSGVRQLDNVDLLASTVSAAGDFGAMIVRPLCLVPISNIGCGAVIDYITGIPAPIEIKTDACLAVAFVAQSTTIPQVHMTFHFIEA